MSVERLWFWTCDVLGCEVFLQSAGLPRGWVIYHEGGVTKHACDGHANETDGRPPAVYGGAYANEEPKEPGR